MGPHTASICLDGVEDSVKGGAGSHGFGTHIVIKEEVAAKLSRITLCREELLLNGGLSGQGDAGVVVLLLLDQ